MFPNHPIRVFFRGGRGGGASAPLEDFVPPLEIPPKNCFRVNVLAFCSYLLQIPIRVILTCQVSFLIALDAISEHLKFKIFWGEDPPKSLCLKCTGYYTPSSLCSPSKPKISILPPLGEFSKKNTAYACAYLPIILSPPPCVTLPSDLSIPPVQGGPGGHSAIMHMIVL